MVRELSDSIDRKIGQAREHRAEVVSARIQRFERRPIDSNRPGWSWPLDFSHGVGLFSFARRTMCQPIRALRPAPPASHLL